MTADCCADCRNPPYPGLPLRVDGPVSFYSPSKPDGRSRMGGSFADVLNVAGAFVGDPQLGEQIASQAKRGYAPITQDAQAIAANIAPTVLANLKTPPTGIDIDALSKSVAAAAAPAVAANLAAQGYTFPPGSMGAEYLKPSVLDAFGGQNRQWVYYGALGLGALLLIKQFR